MDPSIAQRFFLELGRHPPTVAAMAGVITAHHAKKISEPEWERIVAERECFFEEKVRLGLASTWKRQHERIR